MGGGAGLSMNAKFRIVTENTVRLMFEYLVIRRSFCFKNLFIYLCMSRYLPCQKHHLDIIQMLGHLIFFQDYLVILVMDHFHLFINVNELFVITQ